MTGVRKQLLFQEHSEGLKLLYRADRSVKTSFLLVDQARYFVENMLLNNSKNGFD